MRIVGAVISTLFGAALHAAPPEPAQDAQGSAPASFQRTVGRWTIAGDPKSFGCIAIGLVDGSTKLTIATLPNRTDYVFALANAAWKSIEHDAEMRITANFLDGRGRLLDSWDLSTTGVNGDGTGPAFNFFIERAANDGASFRNNFAAAHSVAFLRDRVPIGRFDLSDSGAALAHLDLCRAELRRDPGFDPFAR